MFIFNLFQYFHIADSHKDIARANKKKINK